MLLNLKIVKRVLVTGGTGLLGVAIQRSAPKDIQGFSIYFPERSLPVPLPFPILAADVSDRMEMQSVFEWAKPDVVIHTGAIGSVDFAEKNREQTRKINVGGTEVVAELCQIFESRLIYISSNAVFDGRTPFYSETAPVNPINYYGQLKVDAENVVRESTIPWTIVRPILMYGWPYQGERDNPVVWWVRFLENGKPIKVVDNVFNKPLPAWSCADVIWAIIQQNRTGIYHAAGRDHISLYQFALLTAAVFGLDASLITPVPDSYFPEIAPRPKDTSFDTTKMETELGVKTVGVRDGLFKMKAERTAIL
ncbi:MAG: SDR family oxidoreductase [Deltaproteobacteria bacterium]|nr:MAG: SDR family oxidoreductase [Deltaproteobacteria bacterium]